MKEEEIRVINLSKEYHVGEETVHALKDVNLKIEKGSFGAIVGTSGSGKSTLLHMLGGLDRPDSGEIYVGEDKITEKREKELARIRRDKIGFVFQRFNLIQELNVVENIVLPVLLAGNEVDTDYIEGLLDKLGLADRKNHIPSELSGGQQQRVAIARALANHPDVILCDEPTGNLDKKTSKEVMELLRSVNREYEKTVLVVTHDQEIAKEADYCIQIEDGSIL